mgnify:CR=1 FL=1
MRTDSAGALAIAGRSMRRTRVVGGVLSVAAALCGALTSDSARAQDPGAPFDEPPASPFNLNTPRDGFSIVEPPAGVPAPRRDGVDDGSGRWFFQGWSRPPREATAEDLYTSAMDALQAGRRDEAQRLFERLISEAPRSPRVHAARQHLGEIYRSIDAEAQAAPAAHGTMTGASELPWAGGGKAPAAKAAALDVSQAVPRGVIHQARVSPAVDGQFLSDAGDRVFFGTGNAVLGTRAQGVIQSQARFLLRYPNIYAAIEGYADDGAMSDAETMRLSEERAAVVRDRLVAEGVEAHRLVAYGRGSEDRVSDCPAPECMAQNRRAVTILLNRRIESRPVRRAQGDSGTGTSAPSPMQ